MARPRGQLAAALAVVALVAVSTTAPVMAEASIASRWQSTSKVTGIPNITWLGCSAVHECVAFGGASVDAEVSGTWTAAAPIENLPAGATIGAIACPSPLDCVVGGSSGGQAFLIDEVSGVWGSPQLIGGTAPYVEGSPTFYESFASSISAISCASVGKCTAAGNYTITTQPNLYLTFSGPGFVTNLSSGTWSTATLLSGVDAVTGLSCPTSSGCTVSGYSTTFEIFIDYPIVTNTAVADTETISGWEPGVILPGLTQLGGKTGWIDSEASSLRCVSPGNCTLGGNDEYAPDFDGNPVSLYNAKFYGFVAREVNGTWSSALELKALKDVPYLACSSATHCVAADSGHVYLENRGRWGSSRVLTASGRALVIGAVACSHAGHCLAAGSVRSSAFAVLASAGTWSGLQRLARLTTVGAASCPGDGFCVVAGGSRVISQR